MVPPPTFAPEASLRSNQSHLIVGIDEVGRGSLAGPVVAAAVCFPPNAKPINQLHDSKLLSSSKRIELLPRILSTSLHWQLGLVGAQEIDRQGIIPATDHAMQQTLSGLRTSFSILVDGSHTPSFSHPQLHQCQSLVKGDRLSLSIAAASVLAKVYRDALMQNLAKIYLQYGWSSNKGYGTLKHRNAIKTYGATIYHRKSFIKNII